MIEGRHFKDAGERRRTVAKAIDRYIKEEVPRKAWWRRDARYQPALVEKTGSAACA